MSLQLGKQLVQRKQFKKAFVVIQNLLKDNPKDFRNNFLAGQMYYRLNELEKSNTFFHVKGQLGTSREVFRMELRARSIPHDNERKQ